jgi:predicted transcriptional regulator
MLHKILEYIVMNKTADLNSISLHFNIEKKALEGMLYILIKKNKIKELTFKCGNCNGGCDTCPFGNSNKIYTILN